MHPDVKLALGTAITGGLGFGLGCAVGAIAGGPILVAGAVVGVNSAASYAFDELNDRFAVKFDWNLSTHQLSKHLGPALLSAAALIALFALGIIGPVGLGIMLGIAAIGAVVGIVKFANLRLNDTDISYRDHLKKIEEEEQQKEAEAQRNAAEEAQKAEELNRRANQAMATFFDGQDPQDGPTVEEIK